MKKPILALFLILATALTANATLPLHRRVMLGGPLADGKIVVGNSSGKGSAVTPTGDVTITNAGVTAIGAGKVLESMLAVPDTDGLNAKRIARATYDVAVDLGTVAAHGLGVTLPAKSVILNVWFYTVTQFVDAGSGTVAYSCEDANNLYTAADVTGITVGSFTAGQPVNTVATMVGSISAACEITATVATAAQTAGKAIIFVEYVVVE